jgi:serine/threonine kinase PknH
MALFISYSSRDRSTVDALTSALRRGQQQVWFDQELGGGDAWWNKILEQIRSCEVFIVALSNNWLQSKPSQSELRYAKALNRPILPVRIGEVDSMRVNPLAALQIIDYRDPTVDAGIQLVTAVHGLRSKPVPLPDPLPEEPPVPFAYITRLGNTLAEKELSPQQQLQLLVELRSGLDEDGDDPSARSDIAQLLRMLRLRHDVTYRTRNEIDNVLASIESADADSSAGPSTTSDKAQPTAPTTPTQPGTGPQPVSGPQPAKPSVATTIGGGPGKDAAASRRLIIIGGAALAVIVAIVVAVIFIGQGSGPKKTPASARTAAPAAPELGAPGQAAPAPGATAPVAPGSLDSILLGPPQVSTLLGAPTTMEIAGQTTQLRPDVNLSNAGCLGAFDPIQNSAYVDYNPTGVRGQALHTPDNNYRVYEGAVSFQTAAKAHEFVAASAAKWKACAGLPVQLKDGKIGNWTFGGLTGAAPRITQPRAPGDPSRSACERVLSAVSDVVLDVLACAPGIQDQGGQITDQMAGNVKR